MNLELGNSWHYKAIKGKWKLGEESDLRIWATKELKPILGDEKEDLHCFGIGKEEGVTANRQLYPTDYAVLELDVPKESKIKIKNGDRAETEKWSRIMQTGYVSVRDAGDIPFRWMYLTPSTCGIRFVVKVSESIRNEAMYKSVVRQFLAYFDRFGFSEENYDILVNQAWIVPQFKDWVCFQEEIFEIDSKSASVIDKPRKATLQIKPTGDKQDLLKTKDVLAFLKKRNRSITDDYDTWYRVCFALIGAFELSVASE